MTTSTLFDDVAKDLTSTHGPGRMLIHASGATPLESTRFIQISDPQLPGTACYIDGGNAEIFGTPSHHVQLCRAAAVTFANHARTGLQRVTACVHAHTTASHIHLKTHGARLELPAILLDDPDLRPGNQQVKPETTMELARVLLEHQTALDAASTLLPDSMLVMDGDITVWHPSVAHALQSLLSTCHDRSVTLVSVAKTSTAKTDTGIAAGQALHAMEPSGMWAYPLLSTDTIHRAFVRLHPSSSHVFLLASPMPLTAAILARLAGASTDLAFPGYPYGLIIADQAARVSAKEQETAHLLLATKAIQRNPDLARAIAGSNAHAILDRMQY